ncbi:hypothetical protein C0991_011414 [Blastosporella zonata]|nr:hypothetical protein C0991_011414 [Blastosporella zonata]
MAHIRLLRSTHTCRHKCGVALIRVISLIPSIMSTKTSSELVEFSTCEISDALIKLNVPHGGHIPDIVEMFPLARICAPAYTVRMADVSDELTSSTPRPSSHFVDMAPSGFIIVIDAPPRLVNPLDAFDRH